MSNMIDEAIEALLEKRRKQALEYMFDRLLSDARSDEQVNSHRFTEWLADKKREYIR